MQHSPNNGGSLNSPTSSSNSSINLNRRSTKRLIFWLIALPTLIPVLGLSLLASVYFSGAGVATASNRSANSASQPFNFSSFVFYPTGSSPNSVALGDFNSDGKLDAVTANINSNGVSVLLGNGNGTFQPATNYATGNGASQVVVGDFNGDNRLDIACANSGSSNLSIVLGNGDGTFQAAINYPISGNPSWLAIGDLNEDGKPDIVTANTNLYAISVLLNDGNGTFQAPTYYTTSYSPYSLIVADFNRDGKLDIATANHYSNHVDVFVGNGAGNFQFVGYYPIGINGAYLAIGDFNADGNLDLAGAGDSSVSVLLGNGNGTFQAPAVYKLEWLTTAVVVGDFNADGKLDIAAAIVSSYGTPTPTPNEASNSIVYADKFKAKATTSSGSSVLLLAGKGDGTFVIADDFNVSSRYYSNIPSIAIGDFNADNWLDIITANPADNAVSVLLNTTCSPLLVTGATDDGSGTSCGTLSYAIKQVADVTQPVTITLNTSQITFTGAMPVISNTHGVSVTVTGGCSTQNNGRGVPGVQLVAGSGAGNVALTLKDNVNINGLAITGFSGYALDITGNNNQVTCSWLGTADGLNTSANGGGIRLGVVGGTSANNNRLGLPNLPQSGNLISGNSGVGIQLNNGANNQLYYTWVGLQKDGITDLKNGGAIQVATAGKLSFKTDNRVRN